MKELNKEAFGTVPDRFLRNMSNALKKEEKPMKRKVTTTLVLALLIISLLATAAYAVIRSFDFGSHLDWNGKDSFPGKYVAVGVHKGDDDSMPYYEGKSLVALYDPVDLNGFGPGVYWQGYWHEEARRNKEISEIDNPVFLIAEYDEEQLIGLREISLEEIENLTQPEQSVEHDDTQALIDSAIQAYSLSRSLALLRVADPVAGEFFVMKAPLENGESAYLLTQFVGDEFMGLQEVTEEAYKRLVTHRMPE